MNERSYSGLVDRSRWDEGQDGEGPWQDEPDKVVWVDDATGFDCMILRNRMGALCGYLGVPQGHPWWEKSYSVLEDPGAGVDVHGGLTFAGHCDPDATEDQARICHDPTGRPEHVWWLGFDCSHFMDFVPSMFAADRELHQQFLTEMGWRQTYRTMDYVRNEIVRLAVQAKLMAGVSAVEEEEFRAQLERSLARLQELG